MREKQGLWYQLRSVAFGYDVAKALLLDKVVKSGAVKKGEIRLQQAGMIPIDFAVFKYGKGVAALANADFDRTKAAADRFERTELRLMVRLLLAQALLRGDDSLKKGCAMNAARFHMRSSGSLGLERKS